MIGALTSVLLIWVGTYYGNDSHIFYFLKQVIILQIINVFAFKMTVTGILVYLAVQRVVLQEFEIDSSIMLITSGIGLIVNVM